MKTQHFLLSSIAALVAQASPARRDCGATKTFTATNDCGIPYGGTWVECASGMTATPTFIMPSCSNAARSAPLITGAPQADGAIECKPLTVCIDAIASCGGTGTRIGTCYDTCRGEPTLSTPTCTIPPPTTTAKPSSVATPETEADREVDPACVDEPWMCAPEGW